MQRTPVSIDPAQFPAALQPLLSGAQVYDSSCSPHAKVYFIDKDGGFYLKIAPKGTLATEASVTEFFHQKGLSAEVLAYLQEEKDFFLTRRIPGEDCIDSRYLADPNRLAETTGLLLRQLHEIDPTGCPVNRTESYLATARKNYEECAYEADLFPDNWGYRTPEDAWAVVQELAPELKMDTLIHGDYCLPNILLEDWRFSGFIDLDSGGLGDKHIDLFWGAWTLRFNLKTDRWCSNFLDAYGREAFDGEILKAIAAFEVFG